MIYSVSLRALYCALIAFSSALGADFYQNGTTARSAALGGVLLPNGESVSDTLNTNPAALTRLSSGVLEGSLSTLIMGGSFVTRPPRMVLSRRNLVSSPPRLSVFRCALCP